MSSGICVEKIGSVQIFLQEDGTYDAFDFATGKYIADPYHDKPKDYKPVKIRKSKEEIAEEMREIESFSSHALDQRGLKKWALDYFEVKVGVSRQDGSTPEIVYFPYTSQESSETVRYKVRLLTEKKMWAVGDDSEVDLFGWKAAIATGAKRLYITEGEFDAIALFQIFKDHNRNTPFADFNPAIVSLPNGVNSARHTLAKLAGKLKRFQEIVFVFDDDEAGRAGVEAALQAVPSALSVTLPLKDANECLMEGRSKAAYNACTFNSTKPKNTRLVMASDVFKEARQQTPWGFSYPYNNLTQLTRGQRLGECIYWGAGVKMGKSEILNDLVAHNIREHGWKNFVCKTEESNKRTVQGVAGKLVGKIFHDPSIPFDFDAYDKGCELIGDKLIMLNLYQELTWEVLKGDIRAAALEGCKAVFIDPITTLTNTLNPADANTLLQKMAQELAQMAMDLQIVCHIFCHLRAPEGGLPHERGGSVQSTQFAGSRAMMRSCHAMIGIEGNKDPSLTIEERNLRDLVLLEDRQSGLTGKTKLYYDNATGMFNEVA